MTAPDARRIPALADSRKLRFSTLCALYFAQGVPWGFVSIALIAVLAERGATLAQTGLLISLCTLPWTFKFFWGPIIDSYRVPSMGLRRPWIIGAQLFMAATLLVSFSIGDLTSDTSLKWLGIIFFAHNCFASLQDVATDALAIDLLEESERGRVNGFMWGSKLLGISIGGAGMATVMAKWGLEAGMQVQAAVILLIMLFPLLLRERAGEKLLPWSSGQRMVPELARRGNGPLRVARELLRAFTLKTTVVGIFVALTAFVAEGLATPVTAEVFTQHIGWTAEKLSHAQGIWGTVGKLLGAIGGGLLCDRIGVRRIAIAGIVLASASFLVFGLTSPWWTSEGYPLVVYITMIEMGLSMTSVALLAMFMKISWTQAAATQFTLFMTLSNVGFATGPFLTRLGLGYMDTFLLCSLLTLAPLTLLGLLDPESVVRRRMAERKAGAGAAGPDDAEAADPTTVLVAT